MNAADVDQIPCPLCSRSSCEATAKAVWVRGFLIMYQISRRQLIGCVDCVRRELLKEAGKSAILGWFSITSIFINPVLILYNLIRAVAISPNKEAVARKLTELGVEPTAEGVDLLQIMYALLASLIAADGKIDPTEIQAAADLGSNLFEEFSIDRFKETCQRHSELPPPVDLGTMVREVLDDKQKAIVLRVMISVAQADGTLSGEEEQLILAVATGMDFDINLLADETTAEE